MLNLNKYKTQDQQSKFDELDKDIKTDMTKKILENASIGLAELKFYYAFFDSISDFMLKTKKKVLVKFIKERIGENFDVLIEYNYDKQYFKGVYVIIKWERRIEPIDNTISLYNSASLYSNFNYGTLKKMMPTVVDKFVKNIVGKSLEEYVNIQSSFEYSLPRELSSIRGEPFTFEKCKYNDRYHLLYMMNIYLRSEYGNKNKLIRNLRRELGSDFTVEIDNTDYIYTMKISWI